MTVERKIENTLSFYDKVLDEKNGLIKHLMSKVSNLRDCLERCEKDYHGVITVCRHYSLNASYKDAMETREYIRKILEENL
jgi:hypothetical protein